MNEKFFDLSREKQDRMINGALEVFAKNGYKHASTDDMVKAVDVRKAGLYTFVYGYSVKYMILELSSAMDAQEKDYFEVVRQMEYTKMRVSKSYPYMNLFLQESARETDEDILEQTQADRKILKEKMDGILRNAEIEGISEKAHRDRIKRMIRYTIEGVQHDKMVKTQVEPETVYKEIKNYIELVKTLVRGTDLPAKEDMLDSPITNTLF